MVRVLVCGEGKHDIGELSVSRQEEEGWLQAILRRLLGDGIEIDAIPRKGLVVQRRRQRAFQPLPQGHGRKALACKLRANGGEYDLVVFMADADSADVQRWRTIRQQILDGFGRVNGVRSAPCVPISASESWLLGDRQAWTGLGLEDLGILPSHPEGIWGDRKDPDGNHPHQVFRRACVQAEVDDSRSTRVELAEQLNLDTLRESCPISFARFDSDIRD